MEDGEEQEEVNKGPKGGRKMFYQNLHRLLFRFRAFRPDCGMPCGNR